MTPEQWQRIEPLFAEVTRLPPAERRRFLDDRCGDDPALRGQLERLVDLDAGTDFIDTPALAQASLVDASERAEGTPGFDPLIGRTLGDYRLIERIASGGMGVIYRGVRGDDQFEFEVAVKVVGRDLASTGVLDRFFAERQTLANLAHPNIARLLDGGTTDDGLPYLVMEYIDGWPIDRFCDERRLSIRERLDLFVTVCHAVHFAHQNLVIHRDLKPSNIMVTQDGVPKLLDFGIAKVLDPHTNQPLRSTATGSRLLTPDFASPEQISGQPVTTASDVYSLGVLLFAMLTGRQPYRLTSCRISEIEQAICDKDPLRPSIALDAESGNGGDLAEVATHRASTPDRLRRDLRDDLDNIVLMALRKEPSRRYTSAEQLAEDIDRHVRGLPVAARRDTLIYRSRKFVRRNRAGVAAGLLALAALGVGSVATAIMARVAIGERDLARDAQTLAQREAEHARIESDTAHEITRLLVDTFLGSASEPSPEQVTLVREQLEEESRRVREQFATQRHLQANLLDALGRTYCSAGLFDEAEAMIGESKTIRIEEFGPRSLEVALALDSLAKLALARGRPEQAIELFEEALAIHREAPVGVHTDVGAAMTQVARALTRAGRFGDAEPLYREAIARRVERGRPGTLSVMRLQLELAAVLDGLGRDDEAEALRVEARAVGNDASQP